MRLNEDWSWSLAAIISRGETISRHDTNGDGRVDAADATGVQAMFFVAITTEISHWIFPPLNIPPIF